MTAARPAAPASNKAPLSQDIQFLLGHCPPIVADVTVTHPFRGKSRDASLWGTFKPDALAHAQSRKDARYLAFHVQQNRLFTPLIGSTTGAINADSAVLLWAFAQQAAIRRFTYLHWPIHSATGSELSSFAALRGRLHL